MARSSFKVGDIVQLKSGGPKMTVSHVFSDGAIQATWFAGAKHQTAQFQSDSLLTAPPEADPKPAKK
jgi:uncharacterized protein YodC (DUF2158 family)